MNIAYTTKRISPARLAIIAAANDIMDEYRADGYVLTLRQVYYQFVSRDLMANSQKEYKRLGSILSDGRLCGLISWHSIEDRTRNLRRLAAWEDAAHLIESVAHQYRSDKWRKEHQDQRIEVWIEKEALAGIFDRVCRRLEVPYFCCRGYVSQSEMWAASQRLARHEQGGQTTTILHFGDHDPSGIDMTRDIADRLATFGSAVTVIRCALNMSQIDEHDPPPNPAKLTDARAADYVRRYGYESWELDALDPSTLVDLVERRVATLRDAAGWAAACAEDEAARELIQKMADNWAAVEDFANALGDD